MAVSQRNFGVVLGLDSSRWVRLNGQERSLSWGNSVAKVPGEEDSVFRITGKPSRVSRRPISGVGRGS